MSISDRARMFGDPTDRLVAEAVWIHQRDNGHWPIWEETVEDVARLAECDEEEAEALLLGAVADDEVSARIRGGGRVWGIELDDQAADRITRRYTDMTLSRKETD